MRRLPKTALVLFLLVAPIVSTDAAAQPFDWIRIPLLDAPLVEVQDITPPDLVFVAPGGTQTFLVEIASRTPINGVELEIAGLSVVPMRADASGPGRCSATLPLPACLGSVGFAVNATVATQDGPRRWRAPEVGRYVHRILQRPAFCQNTPPAYSRTYVVNEMADLVDAVPGDGMCAGRAASGQMRCSLHAAIMEANAWPNVDLIRVPTGRYTLTLVAPPGGEPTDGVVDREGDLDITQGVTIEGIDGSATSVTSFLTWPAGTAMGRLLDDPSKDALFAKIDAGGIDRVIHVAPGVTAQLRQVALVNGNAARGPDTSNLGNEFRGGGGILNDGNLRLERVVLVGNRAQSLESRTFGGGGVQNSGVALVEDSLIARNSVGGWNPSGGALFNSDGASAVLRRSLIYANGARFGCALRNGGTGTVRLTNVTIDNNVGSDGGDCLDVVLSVADGAVDLNFVTLSGHTRREAQKGRLLSLARGRSD